VEIHGKKREIALNANVCPLSTSTVLKHATLKLADDDEICRKLFILYTSYS